MNLSEYLNNRIKNKESEEMNKNNEDDKQDKLDKHLKKIESNREKIRNQFNQNNKEENMQIVNLNKEQIIESLKSLSPIDMLQIVTSQMVKLEDAHVKQNSLQSIINDNTANELQQLKNEYQDIKEKQNFSNNDGFYQIQSLGGQLNPPIKNKMTDILMYLNLSIWEYNYSRTKRKAVPSAYAYNLGAAKVIFSSPNEKGESYPLYHYSLQTVKNLIKKHFSDNQLQEFYSQLKKTDRDKWINDNFSYTKKSVA